MNTISYQFKGNLQNIIEQTSLKWIFVGGKGGVGKTTISTSLAILLSKYREKVLIISTDPAHNLSDAFNQKLGKEPTLINGFTNLYGLELDPQKEDDNIKNLNQLLGFQPDSNTKNFFQEIKTSFPGIDEALSLRYISYLVNDVNFSVVVFDTAPTGHTLRLLEMPSLLGKSLEKMIQLKSQFNSVISGVGTMLGPDFNKQYDTIFHTVESLQSSLQIVSKMFKEPSLTTFITVCIPEFLSVYETERLINSLYNSEIDTRNIVVNQVLKEKKDCRLCATRRKMQEKYINQIKEMFEEFHLTFVPLQMGEVRGTQKLIEFSNFLIQDNSSY